MHLLLRSIEVMQRVKLIEETIRKGLAFLSRQGALMVDTGHHTGRSTKERFIVQRPEVASMIDWGPVNLPLDVATGDKIASKLEQKILYDEHYTYQGRVGGYPIEVNSTSPWHILFCANMFRKIPIESVTKVMKDDRTIQVFHDPTIKVSGLGVKFDYETAIILDPVKLKVSIVNTAYAGEIKKSAFTLCNFFLPERGIMPMHASANCLEDGSETCVLFGLSGTGKTTLSASPDRFLIGDDEHVWSDGGVSNLEGGCYAKLIDLTEEREPEIFRAVNRFGSIQENVAIDILTREIDYTNAGKTENTRGSYPLSALDKVFDQGRDASHPKTIVFLTADAFGALPAVAKLDSYQTQYHFISGYTAKVAGTEIGIKEPKATFSACFGAPFMPRPVSVYAELLAKLVNKHNCSVWLLNTGWTEGGYDKGERFPLSVSRQLLSMIQSGALARQPLQKHPVFGFDVVTSCPGVDSRFLVTPQGDSVQHLAERFKENMARFKGSIDPKVIELGGPH
ncbi:MAG: phosphoenolpyruvate carboxykinase (ATP) [Deltaproteobacteria bacterium RIFCSPHIGHO2_02_FULL_50_15]|nr:MAG: phosphoenolpyruvate carboxykinase (ATP) [Deltaproteobacteria bacterium RIFCSPHIGHO2_02_FULL_50_15]